VEEVTREERQSKVKKTPAKISKKNLRHANPTAQKKKTNDKRKINEPQRPCRRARAKPHSDIFPRRLARERHAVHAERGRRRVEEPGE
jgi:hypothetical protein